MGKGPYGIVLLPSTSHAVRCEKVLEVAGMDCRLVPVPRHLSTTCGLAVRFLLEERERVESLLHAAKLEYTRIEPLP